MIKINKPNIIIYNSLPLNQYYFNHIKSFLYDFNMLKGKNELLIIDDYLINKKIDYNEFFYSVIKDDVFSKNYLYSELINDYFSLCTFKKEEKDEKYKLIDYFTKKYSSFKRSEFLTKKGLINKKTSINKMQSYINSMNDKLRELLPYALITPELKHEVLSGLNINVCPYCNRIYISNYVDEDGSKPTSDLDHNYPKSIFPLFALSIFNFIPTCILCNRSFKYANYYLENPYYDSFDDAGFYFKIEHVDDTKELINMKNGITKANFVIVQENSSSYSSTIEGELVENKIKKDIDILKLEKLYNCHSNYAKDILFYKFKRYDQFLSKIAPNASKIIFGFDFNNEEEAFDKPLYKFTKDLIYKN